MLCNCSLHLANLGDCRAVAAMRDSWQTGGEMAAQWPPGTRVEVLDARSEDLLGQRGTVLEAVF